MRDDSVPNNNNPDVDGNRYCVFLGRYMTTDETKRMNQSIGPGSMTPGFSSLVAPGFNGVPMRNVTESRDGMRWNSQIEEWESDSDGGY